MELLIRRPVLSSLFSEAKENVIIFFNFIFYVGVDD